MNSNGSPARLRAIDHQIIGLGSRLARIGLEQREVRDARGGKRVVHRDPAALFFVEFEHGELDDPREMQLARIVHLQFRAQPFSHGRQRLARYLPPIRNQQQQVARFGLHALGETAEHVFAEVLADGRGEFATFFNLEPGEPLAPKSCVT